MVDRDLLLGIGKFSHWYWSTVAVTRSTGVLRTYIVPERLQNDWGLGHNDHYEDMRHALETAPDLHLIAFSAEGTSEG